MCRSSTATRPGPPRIWPRAGAGHASATSCSGRRHGSPGCTSCSSACSKGGVAPCCAASPPSACSSSTPVSGSVRDDRTALGAGLSADERRHRPPARRAGGRCRSEEHTSELQSQFHLVCRLLLEKKKK